MFLQVVKSQCVYIYIGAKAKGIDLYECSVLETNTEVKYNSFRELQGNCTEVKMGILQHPLIGECSVKNDHYQSYLSIKIRGYIQVSLIHVYIDTIHTHNKRM